MTQKSKRSTARATAFTVPEVWRTIVKKNERQGGGRFDVLVCSHAVPANDNTYRRARSCPECRVKVQQYADTVRAGSATPPAAATSTARSPARVRAPRTKTSRSAPRPDTRRRSAVSGATR